MSPSTIRIPTPLRSFTGGADEVRAHGGTVGEVLNSLFADHEGLDSQLLDGDGQLRQFVNVFLDGTNVRSLSGLDSPVAEHSIIHIVPAVAGGCRNTSEVQYES